MTPVVSDERAVPALPQNGSAQQIALALRAFGLGQRTAAEYGFRWVVFRRWCLEYARSPLPTAPASVELFITAQHLRALKRGTLKNFIKAISAVHRMCDLDDPTRSREFFSWMRGFQRSTPYTRNPFLVATPELVTELVRSIPLNLLGVRDRSLILMMFAGCLTVADLVKLRVEDIQFGEGLILELSRRRCFISPGTHRDTCPIAALRAWLHLAKITAGPIFRQTGFGAHIYARGMKRSGISGIFRRRSRSAGLRETLTSEALRRGVIQTLALRGIPVPEIAKFTGLSPDHVELLYMRKLPWLGPDGATDLAWLGTHGRHSRRGPRQPRRFIDGRRPPNTL